MAFAALTAFLASSAFNPRLGNVCLVDQVNGHDVGPLAGARGGLPFLTITAALAASLAGDTVLVLPGTYTESIAIGTNRSVVGIDRTRCIIDRTAVIVATDIVTFVGAGSRISTMTLQGSTTAAVQLRGVAYTGAADASNAQALNCTVLLTHTGAGTCIGVQGTGGGAPTSEFYTVSACRILVTGSGAFIRRGISVPGGTGRMNVTETNITVVRTGAAVGTYYGVEANSGVATIYLARCTVEGPAGAGGADVSQTTGTLILDEATLATGNANGLGFTAASGTYVEWFGDLGAQPGGVTRFFRSGTAAVQTTEVALDVRAPKIARAIVVKSRVGAGGGQSSAFTLRRNGALTTVTASLAGGGPGGTAAADVAHSQGYVSGDTYAVQTVNSAATGVTDVQVGIEWYTG